MRAFSKPKHASLKTDHTVICESKHPSFSTKEGTKTVGEGNQEDMAANWPSNRTWTFRGSSLLFCSHSGSIFLGRCLERALLRPSGWYAWLNPVKTSIWTSQILAVGCGDLQVLWQHQTSLVSKFPYLLNLPPNSLEWAASFWDLSFPSVYRNQFMNQQNSPTISARDIEEAIYSRKFTCRPQNHLPKERHSFSLIQHSWNASS